MSFGPTPSTSSPRLRILSAEDNSMLGEVLVRLLTEAGHTCRHVENGMDAWETLFDDLKAFDLVITDHEMPGLTGLQLVEVITASRRFSLAWIMLSCARY